MNGPEEILFILLGAVFLDAFLGEYPRPLHPVVWMGKFISRFLVFAPKGGWWRQFGYGFFLTLALTSLSEALTWGAMEFTAPIPAFRIGVGVFLLKASFSLRELGQSAARVCGFLSDGSLPLAREALRSLCSREPTNLDGEEILQGTIESLAENASDSFVAPLFYFALFGVPGALAYRAINTLDAMVGYRGKYEALGKVSARLDDLANWLPARLTAFLLLLGGWIRGLNAANGWRILRRDGNRTPSPNAGKPMAVMAGLLGVRLEKKGLYSLGENQQTVSVEMARSAWQVVTAASLAMIFLISAGITGLVWLRWSE